MKSPQDITIETYNTHFDKYRERTPAQLSGEFTDSIKNFLSLVPSHGQVLEIGSATGRDARYMNENGFQVLCTDVVPQALDSLQKEGFQTEIFDFRDSPPKKWEHRFDGIWACAVLLHASKSSFPEILLRLWTTLKFEGYLALTLKRGEGEEISYQKMESPRYFSYYSEHELREIIKELPYKIVSIDHLDNDKWLAVILRKF